MGSFALCEVFTKPSTKFLAFYRDIEKEIFSGSKIQRVRRNSSFI